MTDQKGFDLIEEGARRILRQKLQLAFLGTGHKRFEELVAGLIEDHPGQVGGHVGFDESLAHRIEAGADAFLMPSRFEPCGLNQMYSLTYGTPPIVHSVGGLADSVVDATEGTLADGTGNGFVFSQYDTTHLLDAIKRCVSLYGQPEKWQQLVRNGMSGDWSWNRSASDYIGLYERAVACANR